MAFSAIGSLLGGDAQKDAAKKAGKQAIKAAEIEAQSERENQQLYRDIYNSNLNVLGPYNQLGYSAAQARNALLGLDAGPAYAPPPPLTAPAAAGNGSGLGAPPGPGYTLSQPSAQQQIDWLRTNTVAQSGPNKSVQEINAYLAANPNLTPEQKLAAIQSSIVGNHPKVGAAYQDWLSGASTWAPPAATTPVPGTTTATPVNYENAFNKYLDSTGYRFQLGEGLNGLTMANRLTSVDSGAALKSAMDYNREMGKSYFGDYMNYLGQQQGMGVSAAGAVAGQGNIAAGNIGASNSAAGNALAGGQIALGNAALAKGNINANMYGSIGSALSSIFGASSFGRFGAI